MWKNVRNLRGASVRMQVVRERTDHVIHLLVGCIELLVVISEAEMHIRKLHDLELPLLVKP